MNYLLDTNILLIYLRNNSIRDRIEKKFDPFNKKNTPLISVVTVGEIKSIAKRNHWGNKRLELLKNILNTLIVIDINAEDIIESYAEIDAFSQGKLKNKPLGISARNMGKNDLWIAAACHVTQSVFLTTDQDFVHLDKIYFPLNIVRY